MPEQMRGAASRRPSSCSPSSEPSSQLSLLFRQECLFIRRQEENNPDCVPQSETSVVAEGSSLPPDREKLRSPEAS